MRPDKTNIQYDAFISFSSRDQDVAEQIVSKIEEEGLKCFISSRDIKSAENWAERIVDSLDASRMVIYLHTKMANDSVQISREIQRAVDLLKKPFVTYRLTSEEFKGSKAFFIQSLNWIDSLVDPFENIDKLIQSVKDVKEGKEINSTKQNINKAIIWWRSSAKMIIGSLFALILLTSILFICRGVRNQADIKAESAFKLYNSLIMQYSEMDHISDPVLSVNILDRIDSIVTDFSGSRFATMFSFDSMVEKECLKTSLDSAGRSLPRIISSYYEGYVASPVESLKKPLLENISKLEAIDDVLGKETDPIVLAIKSKIN